MRKGHPSKYKYILLKDKHGCRFFTMNGDKPLPEHQIIGYANTIAEAQIKLFGFSYTNSKE